MTLNTATIHGVIEAVSLVLIVIAGLVLLLQGGGD